MIKTLKYIAIAILVVPLTIVTHEIGHFVAYSAFGATNVVLRSVSVSADKDALTSGQIAFAAMLGPVISYLTIAAAIYFSRKQYVAFWILLGLAAPIGRVVNFIYVYFRIAGYDPNPNFDEFSFSRAVGVEPLILSVLTCMVVVGVFAYFLRKVWTQGRFAELGSVVVSIVIGLAVWSFVGPMILP